MTRSEIIALWQVRRDQLERLGALVNGASLYDEVLADFEAFTEYIRLLALNDAATLSGYSADHLGRLVREGTIPNAGTLRQRRIPRAKSG